MMAEYNLSIQAGAVVEFDLALATGVANEYRVQAAVPDTNVMSTNPSVATAELVAGPKISISALTNGDADIRIDSGGLTIISTTVEDTASGLRWIPTAADAPGVTTAPEPIDPFPPGSVDGPNSSPNGDSFYIQRDSNDVWYVWWSVDADPQPDVKKRLSVVFASDEVSDEYKADISNRAAELGYMT